MFHVCGGRVSRFEVYNGVTGEHHSWWYTLAEAEAAAAKASAKRYAKRDAADAKKRHQAGQS